MTLSIAGPEPLAATAVLDDPLEQGRYARWVAGAGGLALREGSLQLSGMYCAACSGIIEQALLAVPGVHGARVSAAVERATVTWDPERVQPSALLAAVRGAGYDAVPDAAAPARAMRQQARRQALWRLFVAGFCAMQVMMMATPSYVAGPEDLAPDLRQLLNWGSWILALPVLIFSSGPFLRGAWRSLSTRRMSMDVPVALGILITFVASTGATFDPGGVFGDEVYFDSMTMFVSFLLGSRYVEMTARHRAAESIESALARLPETAWRIGDDGQTEAVSVMRLRPGDRVRVPVGQAFPADGLVLEGRTEADEALLSGESEPVPKATGDEVVAGSVNRGAPVSVLVQRVGGDTRFEAIVSMMRSALTQRPAAARLADRWATPFLWVVLILAALGAAVWSVIDPARALWVAVAVLIVTCPCALSLAAPSAIVAAARGLARRGVLVQRLDALEWLASANQAFLDKTGTLTEDRIRLHQVLLTPHGESLLQSESQALALAASLATWSSHPLARALVASTGPPGPTPSAAAEEASPVSDTPPSTPPILWRLVQEQPGHGLSALDEEGREWRLGSADWVAPAAGVDPSVVDARVWLGCQGQACAAFMLEEALRPGAAEAVQALQRDGMQVTLLSGDRLDRAQALARRVGVDAVQAQATPQTKLEAVAAAQAQGRRVLMVGDGVNDAPVLARADISLAMGQGALVARSQADAVITSNHLADLVAARRTAQRTVRIVRQNFWWAGGYNALCIPLALMGWLPPWAAGLGMALSSLLVIFNAQRAAR